MTSKMGDKFSKKTRSKIMSKIKGKNTFPEKILRKELSKKGYRYRLHKKFSNKYFTFYPDITIISKKICIFVDGCFWHGCPKCYKEPKSNKNFWISKIGRNMDRDRQHNEYLKKEGWKIIRVWEHEINGDVDRVVKRIQKNLK